MPAGAIPRPRPPSPRRTPPAPVADSEPSPRPAPGPHRPRRVGPCSDPGPPRNPSRRPDRAGSTPRLAADRRPCWRAPGIPRRTAHPPGAHPPAAGDRLRLRNSGKRRHRSGTAGRRPRATAPGRERPGRENSRCPGGSRRRAGCSTEWEAVRALRPAGRFRCRRTAGREMDGSEPARETAAPLARRSLGRPGRRSGNPCWRT